MKKLRTGERGFSGSMRGNQRRRGGAPSLLSLISGLYVSHLDGTFESGGAPFVLTPGDHVFGRKFRRN